MFLTDNNLVNELSKSTKTSPAYTRKILNGLYSHLLNELLFKGVTSDYFCEFKLDKETKKISISKLNPNFKKVIEGNVDKELIVNVIEESDVL
jgi:hypothetical protein